MDLQILEPKQNKKLLILLSDVSFMHEYTLYIQSGEGGGAGIGLRK